MSELKQNLAIVPKKLDELESRSRRSNLIVYGVKEQDKKTAETLHKADVKEIFEDSLDVRISGVERIHHIGMPKQGDERKIRTMIINLLDYCDKSSVIQNFSKLKGSAFSASEDFSRTIRDVRKKLWIRTKQSQARQEKVRLVYDKVKVDGRLYHWEEGRNGIVELAKYEEQK